MGKQGTRRGIPAILACALALLLCALAPRAALADEGTIEGTCVMSGARYTPGTGFEAEVTMPDGAVLPARCYESYVGDPMHEWYLGPCNGSYAFTATRSADGSYFVLIHSENAECSYDNRPANGVVGHRFQRTFVAAWNPQVSVTFTKCSADATVTSGNSEYAYAGAGYDIYNYGDDSFVTHITTDGNGHASYKLDANRQYYAVETDAPQGFVKSSERHYFRTGNSTSDERLQDDPGTIRLTISKKDAATLGEAQPGATLAGAEYRVDSLSTPGWSATGTTDEKGRLTIHRIPIGKIVVTETKAPRGYKLDSTPHTYEIHADQVTNAGTYELTPEDDFREAVQAFDLEIAKTAGASGSWDASDGQARPCAGVQFQVISNTTGEVVGTLTTNERGFASTRDASTYDEASRGGERSDDAGRPWFGKGRRTGAINGAIPYDERGYTIHEVPETVPAGLDHVDDWQVTADQMVDGALLQYQVNDAQLDTRIQILKQDSASGQTVPLAGFSFQLLDADGDVVSVEDPYKANATVDTFTTDEDGQVTIPSRVRPGTYRVREVAARAPYVVSGDVEVTVSDGHAQATPLTVVRFGDDQARGSATITKTCSEDGKIA